MRSDITYYLHKNSDSIEKWNHIQLEHYPSIESTEYVPEMTPYFGTEVFDQLNENQKNLLYKDLIHFVAEIIIFLEDLYVEHFLGKTKEKDLTEKEHKTIHKFVEEEDYHRRQFRKFIDLERNDGRKEGYLFLTNNFVIKGMSWAVRHSPFCFLVAAAKSEAFSVEYAKYAKEKYGSWNHNRWSKLNELHLLDEAHHVPFQIDLYNLGLEKSGLIDRFKIFFCGLVYIALMQMVLVKTSFKFTNRVYQGKNIFKKIKLAVIFGQWVLHKYPPFLRTHNRVSKLIEDKKPYFYSFYHLIYS